MEANLQTSGWRRLAETNWFDAWLDWTRARLQELPQRYDEVGKASGSIISNVASPEEPNFIQKVVQDNISSMPSFLSDESIRGVCLIGFGAAVVFALIALILIPCALIRRTKDEKRAKPKDGEGKEVAKPKPAMNSPTFKRKSSPNHALSTQSFIFHRSHLHFNQDGSKSNPGRLISPYSHVAQQSPSHDPRPLSSSATPTRSSVFGSSSHSRDPIQARRSGGYFTSASSTTSLSSDPSDSESESISDSNLYVQRRRMPHRSDGSRFTTGYLSSSSCSSSYSSDSSSSVSTSSSSKSNSSYFTSSRDSSLNTSENEEVVFSEPRVASLPGRQIYEIPPARLVVYDDDDDDDDDESEDAGDQQPKNDEDSEALVERILSEGSSRTSLVRNDEILGSSSAYHKCNNAMDVDDARTGLQADASIDLDKRPLSAFRTIMTPITSSDSPSNDDQTIDTAAPTGSRALLFDLLHSSPQMSGEPPLVEID